jgi:hypothetical protein
MRLSVIWLLLIGLLASCSANSIVRNGYRVPVAHDLAYVSPVTTVAVMHYSSPAVANKEATLESARLLHLALVQHRAELRLRNEVVIPDSLLLQARHEVYEAVLGIEQHWQLAGSANLPVLDYLLSQQSQRYALLTVASGFTRIPKLNIILASGSRRLGSYPFFAGPTGMMGKQATSNIFLLIYDRQQKAIVYYRRTPPISEREPLDAASLEKQFAKLLEKDFRPAKALN